MSATASELHALFVSNLQFYRLKKNKGEKCWFGNFMGFWGYFFLKSIFRCAVYYIEINIADNFINLIIVSISYLIGCPLNIGD